MDQFFVHIRVVFPKAKVDMKCFYLKPEVIQNMEQHHGIYPSAYRHKDFLPPFQQFFIQDKVQNLKLKLVC